MTPALPDSGGVTPSSHVPSANVPSMQISWCELTVLMESRRHVSPKRLVGPGPTAAQLQGMLTMAATAPDHGQLTAWRFVIVPAEKRHLLARSSGSRRASLSLRGADLA